MSQEDKEYLKDILPYSYNDKKAISSLNYLYEKLINIYDLENEITNHIGIFKKSNNDNIPHIYEAKKDLFKKASKFNDRKESLNSLFTNSFINPCIKNKSDTFFISNIFEYYFYSHNFDTIDNLDSDSISYIKPLSPYFINTSVKLFDIKKPANSNHQYDRDKELNEYIRIFIGYNIAYNNKGNMSPIINFWKDDKIHDKKDVYEAIDAMIYCRNIPENQYHISNSLINNEDDLSGFLIKSYNLTFHLILKLLVPEYDDNFDIDQAIEDLSRPYKVDSSIDSYKDYYFNNTILQVILTECIGENCKKRSTELIKIYKKVFKYNLFDYRAKLHGILDYMNKITVYPINFIGYMVKILEEPFLRSKNYTYTLSQKAFKYSISHINILLSLINNSTIDQHILDFNVTDKYSKGVKNSYNYIKEILNKTYFNNNVMKNIENRILYFSETHDLPEK